MTYGRPTRSWPRSAWSSLIRRAGHLGAGGLPSPITKATSTASANAARTNPGSSTAGKFGRAARSGRVRTPLRHRGGGGQGQEIIAEVVLPSHGAGGHDRAGPAGRPRWRNISSG